MPNKKIYLDTIKEFEKNAGFSFINRDDIEKKLQEAWKNDQTQAKVDYLQAYQAVFRDVLKSWSAHELDLAFSMRKDKFANFRDCLLKTDEALKVCAMALIPELRENNDVLTNMTFGVLKPTEIQREFDSLKGKYADREESRKIANKRQEDAYNKYKKVWGESSYLTSDTPKLAKDEDAWRLGINVRDLVERIRDEKAMRSMSQDDKIDFALALESLRNDNSSTRRPLGQSEIDLLDDALAEWKVELGFNKQDSVLEGATGLQFQYGEKLRNENWIETEIELAIKGFNQTQNPAKKEIEAYKKKAEEEAKTKEQKEKNVVNQGVDEDTAEMVADFFKQEELSVEVQDLKVLKGEPIRKERFFLDSKVAEFNQKYGLRVNRDKLRTNIEQVSDLMVQASAEKETFLSKDNVVVIENGEEKCYSAKEYFKSDIEKANEEHKEALKKLEEERTKKDEESQEAFEERSLKIDEKIAEANRKLQGDLEILQGGVVIEKNGNEIKRYKSARYYETHETKKEQYAYGEYQQMYSRIYKDACKNLKEQNYQRGKVTDFSEIAKDVDKLFKSAMYASNVYDNEKHIDVMQKCTFGAFSIEQLATFATQAENKAWELNQASEEAWEKQIIPARNIITQWTVAEKSNPKVKPADRVKEALDKKRLAFEKGDVTKKELLDYMLAASSHIRRTYPTWTQQLFNSRQYKQEVNALLACRTALGLNESDSLRSVMNKEYSAIAGTMTKDEVFKSIEAKMAHLPSFKDEKQAFQEEYYLARDKVVAEKQAQLDALKAKDREPMSIPELDEKQNILNQGPRSKPVQPIANKQKDLRMHV